ncbi:Protein of unknown function [Pyronema omphalodes CBS 100304]|uniref:Uncharacterized protein n=1 Tax=Pyronema omphalodes (strain CBS 100304) TaxID=1076935 RepID=U4LMM0_PYROM|nr:Protein of unknown function [Pyronema omphalodes CBS 100304]
MRPLPTTILLAYLLACVLALPTADYKIPSSEIALPVHRTSNHELEAPTKLDIKANSTESISPRNAKLVLLICKAPDYADCGQYRPTPNECKNLKDQDGDMNNAVDFGKELRLT